MLDEEQMAELKKGKLVQKQAEENVKKAEPVEFSML